MLEKKPCKTCVEKFNDYEKTVTSILNNIEFLSNLNLTYGELRGSLKTLVRKYRTK